MTLQELATFCAAVFGVIAILLLSVHVVELERRMANLEGERARAIMRWIKARDEPRRPM